MKACKDCKFAKPNTDWWMLAVPVFGWLWLLLWWFTDAPWRFAKCGRAPKVYGPGHYYCSVERMDCRGSCGPEAKFFEAKRPS